jgi:putative ABC transport system permease protein
MGIRIALGADPRKILLLVMQQGLVLSIIGTALGIAGAVVTTRYLAKMLFGLTPLDASTFVVCSAVFTFVALISSYIPARRVTAVDPLIALRHD